MKLSKKEREKIALQMGNNVRRGETWVGLRPSVMIPKKLNKKAVRREGKALCREYA